jgi:hypothetical protein
MNRKRFALALFLLTLFGLPLRAENAILDSDAARREALLRRFTVRDRVADEPVRRKNRLWKVSLAVLGAVTVADVHSSLGRQEANPLLRSHNGQFSARGVSIKAAIVGTTIGVQYLLLRKNPDAAGAAAYTNFAIAGATGAVAGRNYMLK